MAHSWKLPTLAVVGVLGAIAILLAACGRGGRAEGPAPAASLSAEARPASSAAIVTVEFDVAGMTCGGCAIATEAALQRLDGVRSAEASYDDETGAGRAIVEYDPARVTVDRMVAAVEALGYEPTPRVGEEVEG